MAGPIREYINDQGVSVYGRARSRKTPKPKVKTVAFVEEAEEEGGQLQPIAARVLMKILYAARVCRFDLLRAVCALAQRVTRWDVTCDKRLHKLMCYINTTAGKQLVGFVGDSLDMVRPHLFADADLAGCPVSQRSTSGVYYCAMGPRTRFPLAAISKRQGSVSQSTPEAELVALNHGLRTVAIPALEIWSVLSPSAKLLCHEDNEVAIRVCKSGRNQTMRHLGRVHGVTVAWLNEQYTAGLFDLLYEPSATMAADIFTKGFTNPDGWAAVCRLVSIVNPSDIAEFVRSNGAPLPLPQGGKPGKAGEWNLNEDGSGTWTRWDRGATRYSTLYSTGPARHECHQRVTFDAATGEQIGVLNNFDTAKEINAELPSPTPRDIRSVFHFRSTSKCIPNTARPANEVAAAAWRPTLRPIVR